MRYVNCISSFSQCKGQPTLFASRNTTGQFGQFVLIGKTSGAVEHTIQGTALKYTLAAVQVPLGVGFVAVGVHRATPGGSDAGAPTPWRTRLIHT